MTNQNQLPLAQTEEQIEYWNKLQPVNRVCTTDTYKRTMSGSSDLFANNYSVYNLAARRGLNEEGSDGRMIMAGIEKLLYPWFMNPITQKNVDKAREFFTKKANVKKFPEKAWQAVLDNDGHMPLDVWGLPGGQTFLAKDGKHVPMMSVEGMGALATHLEPNMTTVFSPITEATKAKLMYDAVGEKFAEFGLRSARTLNDHPALMMSLKVGGGFEFTSDDQAVYLFPEEFQDIGTVGHEWIMAYQQEGKSLEEAQEEAFEAFVIANDRSALLPDTINTLYSGLPAIKRLAEKYQHTGKIIVPRFDSGDVNAQAIHWRQDIESLIHKGSVVEDGYTHVKGAVTKFKYMNAGFDPEEIFTGAGGCFVTDNNRDIPSVAYKRSATMHEGKLEKSIKLADDEGKRSIPGQVRVYGRGDTLIVAQAEEKIDGELLSRKLVDNGRIVYNETLQQQNERANATWDQYKKIEYSPMTQAIIDERMAERDAIVAQYELEVK